MAIRKNNLPLGNSEILEEKNKEVRILFYEIIKKKVTILEWIYQHSQERYEFSYIS